MLRHLSCGTVFRYFAICNGCFYSLTTVCLICVVDPKELNKALRRETYRISKKQGLKIQQVDGHIIQRRALGDITNVRQPKLVTSGTSGSHCLSICMRGFPLVYHHIILTHRSESDDFNVTKDNAALTEEERKRAHRNALRRASYRRKKNQIKVDENVQPQPTPGKILPLVSR